MESGNRKRKKDLGPTHPVIAAMLMFAITLVLIVILSTTPGPNWWGETHEMTPTIGAIANPYVSYEYSIHVEKVDPGPVGILDVRYILLDNNSEPVPGIQGDLVDLLNSDLNQNSTYFSYQDNDRDENISAGDMILVQKLDYGGIDGRYHRLLLVYIPTGEKMNGGGTQLG